MKYMLGLAVALIIVFIFLVFVFGIGTKDGELIVAACAHSPAKTSTPFQQTQKSGIHTTADPDKPPRIPTPRGVNKKQIEEGSEVPDAPAATPGC